MHLEWRHRGWWKWLVTADFYLASLLLLIAGLLKVKHPDVSELLQNLLDQDVFPLALILFAARWQAWFEIVMALVALSGWRPLWCARGLAFLYLFFAALIAVAADGYWLEPIDCGCFGSGVHATPAYLLILRNIFIALPLLFAGKEMTGSFLIRWRARRSGH
ncbi:MauE/DoxX family redox-associated membrane protein [Thermodesulfobacteriota bacterium]